MKNRIFQYPAMQAGPHFMRGNILIMIAQRNVEPLIKIYQQFRLVSNTLNRSLLPI